MRPKWKYTYAQEEILPEDDVEQLQNTEQRLNAADEATITKVRNEIMQKLSKQGLDTNGEVMKALDLCITNISSDASTFNSESVKECLRKSLLSSPDKILRSLAGGADKFLADIGQGRGSFQEMENAKINTLQNVQIPGMGKSQPMNKRR